MKKKTPIRFHISEPCNQNWDTMEQTASGKYCGQCHKILIDFSTMTDDELYRLFKDKTINPCGRFSNNQLGRDILPLQKASSISKSRYTLAAIVTIVALNTMPSFAQNNSANQSNVELLEKNKQNNNTSTIIISGQIKTDGDLPLENAKVVFDSAITYTDKDGKFSYKVDNGSKDFHHLYFSKDGLSSEVRTYHIAMGAATFDVTLIKPDKSKVNFNNGTIGLVTFGPEIERDMFLLVTKANQLHLNISDEKKLQDIHDRLEFTSSGIIRLTAFAQSSKEKKIANQFFKLITDHFVKTLGMSPERITRFIDKSKSSNVIYYRFL